MSILNRIRGLFVPSQKSKEEKNRQVDEAIKESGMPSGGESWPKFERSVAPSRIAEQLQESARKILEEKANETEERQRRDAEKLQELRNSLNIKAPHAQSTIRTRSFSGVGSGVEDDETRAEIRGHSEKIKRGE